MEFLLCAQKCKICKNLSIKKCNFALYFYTFGHIIFFELIIVRDLENFSLKNIISVI